ncbi:MAG: hypothetical protein ABI859_13415 [Pseudomonadota bacterium]
MPMMQDPRIAAAMVVLAGFVVASAEAAGLSEGVMQRLDIPLGSVAGESWRLGAFDAAHQASGRFQE